ncbi:uncharacterized protein LOC122260721 [Penaeus japonicus]|uniref:uncharacterized protein LOC122260721 n=1 Tax=Penaeus japonicus TaxID=27405 RepID=UPI001C7179E8|nr:uncharacterized protein LOC122260721 [Penaeus japonicus]
MACSSASTASPVVDVHPEGDGEEPSKKKKGDVSQWKKSVAKRRRNRGQEYVSVGRNKFVPARQVGEPCGCPKRCFEKLGEDTVKLIFDEYWKMGDHNAQSAYLFKMVLSKEVKVPSVGPDSRRKKTYEYGVLINNKRNLLCKKAFLSIHSISETRVWNVLKKVGETGVLPVDRRGTGRPHNKKPDDVLELAHDHIKSLPTCSSHYSRAKSRYRLYLPPGYTHRHCYDLFQLWCEERNVDAEKIISFDGYSKIFSSYNIGTRPPKVDTYSTCDRLDIELEVATEKKEEQHKKDLELQLTLHKTKASEARNLIKSYTDHDDDTSAAICFHTSMVSVVFFVNFQKLSIFGGMQSH